ncbi:MAG: 4-(cytidine 5'-diphospho)-2-C-methyl-D-erythritol kinase [Micrococcales bacterium]|nr:MAG: 4-(cytidine 5'-diphospho)-2-C-methyl-D-erythritol kinase [Micrococcales bacterium]PIE27173.1 MAG: 4-(cytidine 5'-diphospho)-2-C-methyl-D-erythritol kinase [Micrococcales bacterium]
MPVDEQTTKVVHVQVPAKINLALRVGPTREDGYHELATVFQAVSLFDRVTASHARGFSLDVDGPDCSDVPTGTGNLAIQAAQALAARTGHRGGVHLRIDKQIPVAGGMAGGSADAAAALVACDALWGSRLPPDELHRLAAGLGADVPFCLHGGTVVGTGRGDQLAPVAGRGQWHWVVAVTGLRLSTPAVFAECDRLRGGEHVGEPYVAEALLAALRHNDPATLAPTLVNDLQPAALSLQPALWPVLDAGTRSGALAAVVCGSGPTTVFLVRDQRQAHTVAQELQRLDVVAAATVCTGPVPGARLVEQVARNQDS